MVRKGRVVSSVAFLGPGEARIGVGSNPQQVELTPRLVIDQQLAFARIALLKQRAAAHLFAPEQ